MMVIKCKNALLMRIFKQHMLMINDTGTFYLLPRLFHFENDCGRTATLKMSNKTGLNGQLSLNKEQHKWVIWEHGAVRNITMTGRNIRRLLG